MKNIALILSCIIFVQSLTVAGIAMPMTASTDQVQACSVSKNATSIQDEKHACCAKKDVEDQQGNDTDKGCCGDDCKCVVHAKVFFASDISMDQKYNVSAPESDKNIFPVFVHSYDFHAKLIYPPQA